MILRPAPTDFDCMAGFMLPSESATDPTRLRHAKRLHQIRALAR
jgi:hypothetical protein